MPRKSLMKFFMKSLGLVSSKNIFFSNMKEPTLSGLLVSLEEVLLNHKDNIIAQLAQPMLLLDMLLKLT